MPEQIDREVDAIKAVLTALEPLSPTGRSSVLEYVVKRLQVNLPVLNAVYSGVTETPARPPHSGQASAADQVTPVTHIRQLKDQKKPRSANEMAALVAYYLAELAADGARKKTINAKDIETQFKIAGFPLPDHVQMTLPNAKNAGYFDAVGDGEYRLNAVGHNLVVHSMPRGASSGATQGKKRGKKGRAKTK
jgi:hypothetical protein